MSLKSTTPDTPILTVVTLVGLLSSMCSDVLL